jgi:hypothetical protein
MSNNNPFDLADRRLCSLVSVIAASDADCVNCDEAETVGASISKDMDNISLENVAIKRSQQIKSLAALKSTSGSMVNTNDVDADVLFSRLVIFMSCTDHMEPYFQYELAAEPTSLFSGGFMRKADKSVLAKELLKSVDSLPADPNKVLSCYVIDGGFLLHKVK